MRLLLDTHTLLWFALADPQLSGTARTLIMEPANAKLVSPASYWEIGPQASACETVAAALGRKDLVMRIFL